MAEPPRPTFVGRLRANWGGEQDARPLEALRQAGKVAYQELMLADQLRDRLAAGHAGVWDAPPAAAGQLLSAWCATALQTLGESILDAAYAAEPRTAGYLPPETYDLAWKWLAGVGVWLSRARQAAASSGYDVARELTLPAALPTGAAAKGAPAEHQNAMFAAIAPIRQHAEVSVFHLERHAPPEAAAAIDRLRQLVGLAAAGSDYLAGLRGVHGDEQLYGLVEERIRTVLGQWFQVGQLAAMPALIAAYEFPRAEAPVERPRPALPPRRPADEVFQGRGNKVIQRLDLPAGRCVAKIAHDGAHNFAVWTLTAGGDDLDLLVNHIGVYRGVRPLNFEQTPAGLRIEADGAWQVAVQPLARAPEWRGSGTGRRAAVLRVPPGALPGPTVVRVAYHGADNFLVAAHGEGWELLANEVGRYDGEARLPAGTVALEIDAAGPWSIEAV